MSLLWNAYRLSHTTGFVLSIGLNPALDNRQHNNHTSNLLANALCTAFHWHASLLCVTASTPLICTVVNTEKCRSRKCFHVATPVYKRKPINTAIRNPPLIQPKVLNGCLINGATSCQLIRKHKRLNAPAVSMTMKWPLGADASV